MGHHNALFRCHILGTLINIEIHQVFGYISRTFVGFHCQDIKPSLVSSQYQCFSLFCIYTVGAVVAIYFHNELGCLGIAVVRCLFKPIYRFQVIAVAMIAPRIISSEKELCLHIPQLGSRRYRFDRLLCRHCI